MIGFNKYGIGYVLSYLLLFKNVRRAFAEAPVVTIYVGAGYLNIASVDRVLASLISAELLIQASPVLAIRFRKMPSSQAISNRIAQFINR